MPRGPSLAIVANRLPVNRVSSAAGPQWEQSAGGLVTAVEPILKRVQGDWYGWPGGTSSVTRPFKHDGLNIVPVNLSKAEVDGFYHGMSNGTFWPLYHGGLRPPIFDAKWWDHYVEVNRRFARVVARRAKRRQRVWIHDYHLQLVPAMLRAARPDLRIGFFLHIPFPPVELFEWLPWRSDVLTGLLGSDVIGFQTDPAVHNFARLARRHADAEGPDNNLAVGKRRVRVAAFPISIDAKWFETHAKKPATQKRAEKIQSLVGRERAILLAVDRIDYTKGIEERLAAFEMMLRRQPNLAKRCVLMQIAVPGREGVGEYVAMRKSIEQTVGRINGQFSEPGRVVVQYFCRNLRREELVAYYCAAHTMLVTPLMDGMNLVAKEFVACRFDGDGLLVLSEFAGAVRELRTALTVNPRHIGLLADTIHGCLMLPARDRRRRMATMRSAVFKHDVHAWSAEFLQAMGD